MKKQLWFLVEPIPADFGLAEFGPFQRTSLDEILEHYEQMPWVNVVLPLEESPSSAFYHGLQQLQRLSINTYILAPKHHSAIQLFAHQIQGNYALVHLFGNAIGGWNALFKRWLDIIIATSILAIIWPLFVIVALAIGLDSKGPVILCQTRIGRYGKPFTMFKFRSMVAMLNQNEFDETLLNIIKHPDDPRITRIGRFLRRTSLDELPQLWNVLRGDMSLVGPRPEMPTRAQTYEWWQYKRFEVPQGMTGWWQINGRANRPMHLHTADDLYYIHHYSVWLDIKILLRTVWVVLTGRGAF